MKFTVIVSPGVRSCLYAVALASLAGSVSFAQTSNADSLPVAPPTAADTALWKEQGRTLPKPEILQPMVDPALPSYQPRTDIELTGHFKGAASDVLPGLDKMWIAAFEKYYPKVKVEVPPPYSGRTGAQELVKGDVDFALVSRELIPIDITDFKAKLGYDPLSVPISGGTYRHFGFLDAVAFMVNKDNPIEKLTFAQLDGILSTTHYSGGAAITTRGQPGLPRELADKPIHIWGVKPWNGFEEFIRQRVLSTPGNRGDWRTDINFVETVFHISGHVAEDKYAIGYSGLAYVGKGVKLVALSNSDSGSFYPPSYEEVARARYLLSRVLYFNVNKPPGKHLNPALEEFVKFILSKEGQQIIINQAIFIPLRSEQVAHSRTLLE